jgi:magnesium chelatase family protein
MLAKVISAAIVGLEAEAVDVEVDVTNGYPSFAMVGLPDAAVKESRDRVHSAIKNSGLTYPGNKRITVNLAPADLRKEGPAYDLPIAVGVLAASQQIWPDRLEGAMFIGELSLDGTTRHTKGILPLAALARDCGYQSVFVPKADAREAALLPDVEVFPVTDLAELVGHLTGLSPIQPVESSLETSFSQDGIVYAADFADIMGQEHVKRAMEIAAAGAHNVLMSGPPGSGKTLIAKSLPGILPRMSVDEALEVTKIYSIAGLLPADTPLIRHRPFRSPHHTISPRRAAGVRAEPHRSPAPAVGRAAARGQYQPCLGHGDLSGQLHAHCRPEPLSLRLLRRSGPRLYLQQCDDHPLPEADQRSAHGPHRHPHRSAAGAI